MPQIKKPVHLPKKPLSQTKEMMYDFYAPIEKAYEWNAARLLELVFGEC